MLLNYELFNLILLLRYLTPDMYFKLILIPYHFTLVYLINREGQKSYLSSICDNFFQTFTFKK